MRLAIAIGIELEQDGIEMEEVLAIFYFVLHGNFSQFRPMDMRLLLELKTKVFAGNPTHAVALSEEMVKPLDLALRVQFTHNLSATETFQIFLWNASQTTSSLIQRYTLFRRIGIFPCLKIEKESVLEIFHPQTNIEKMTRAIEQLIQWSKEHSIEFTVALK